MSTINVTPALNATALFAKSQHYMQKALRRKSDGDVEEYQFWASLALELLGKSALAEIHPSLIADPTHYPSLFAASGINVSADIKTITAKTLYERLRHALSAFGEKQQKFCQAIALRRNAELHSGATPFIAMELGAWEAEFWFASERILTGMNLGLDEWLGVETASAPKETLSHALEAKTKATELRIEDHRDRFLSNTKAQQTSMLEDAAAKRVYHYQSLFSIQYDDDWSASCPACTGKAYMAGDQISEEVVDEGEGPWEMVKKTFVPEEFHCPVCDLILLGQDEIKTAGLELEHEEIEEREFEYEPDYGND